MPRPTARVFALLEILQRGGSRTVRELADELDVDERTVRRYIEHLRELDIPVVGTRGRYGGYHLASGRRMSPLMLTEDQALALVLGLMAAQRSGLVASAPPAVEAAARVLRALPETSARRVDAVLENVGLSAPAISSTGTENRVLLMVASAARERRPIWFEYTARDGHRSSRTLQPYGIVAHEGRWYVTGHDSAHGEVRIFRLDRISSPTLLSGAFDPPEGFDPVAAVLDGLAATPWRYDVSVRIRAGSDELRRRLPAAAVRVEDAGPSGWSRVRIRAERLDWVAALLAGIEHEMVIETPAELRAQLRELAARLRSVADRS